MLRKILLGGVASSFVVLASGGASAVMLYGDEMDRARETQPGGTGSMRYRAPGSSPTRPLRSGTSRPA